MIEQAITQYRDVLWGVCYRMLGCPADADDALQATWEKALAHPPKDSAAPLRPWLLRIALNQCRDELRRRKTRRGAAWLPGPIETPDEDPRFIGAEGPDAQYSRMESVSLAFLVAIQALSPLQRAVLILRDVLDLSIEETAAALDTTASSVKMALQSARLNMERTRSSAQLPSDRAREVRRIEALMIHFATHNVAALTAMLADDVVMHNDADPDQVAAHRDVHGRDKVMLFSFKTARSARRIGLRVLNGEMALVAELGDRRTPSSGRVIGTGNGIARELPRRAVMWFRADAAGRVVSIDVVTTRRKLSRLDFAALEKPSLRGLVRALVSAVRMTQVPGVWRRALARFCARRRSR